MKIAIYTLTRDRLAYTKHCFQRLYCLAGYAFDHFVLDNGSTDGTAEWLQTELPGKNSRGLFEVTCLPENVGISRGSNMMLDKILGRGDYDLVIKMDNDCEVETPDLLKDVVKVFDLLNRVKKRMVLSPRVVGINRQPHRGGTIYVGGWKVGLTGIVGGLFHIVQADVYREYRYPEVLPKAWGQDDDFCEWLRIKEIGKGYIEGLVVNHYETTAGQAARFPEYFERKWKEEKFL